MVGGLAPLGEEELATGCHCRLGLSLHRSCCGAGPWERLSSVTRQLRVFPEFCVTWPP